MLGGCINLKVELEPKRNMLCDMTMTITSETPMIQGMIYDGLGDSSDEGFSKCEKLENGMRCSAENLPLGEDGSFADKSTDMFEYISYTKKKGFPKNTFRMEFKFNSSSTNEKSSVDDDLYGDMYGDMSPEELGMTMEIVVKAFNPIKKTNCIEISEQNAVSCNGWKDKMYYVMWDDWFFMSWFSSWF